MKEGPQIAQRAGRRARMVKPYWAVWPFACGPTVAPEERPVYSSGTTKRLLPSWFAKTGYQPVFANQLGRSNGLEGYCAINRPLLRSYANEWIAVLECVRGR